MQDLISDAFFSILAAGFFVGVVVGPHRAWAAGR